MAALTGHHHVLVQRPGVTASKTTRTAPWCKSMRTIILPLTTSAATQIAQRLPLHLHPLAGRAAVLPRSLRGAACAAAHTS